MYSTIFYNLLGVTELWWNGTTCMSKTSNHRGSAIFPDGRGATMNKSRVKEAKMCFRDKHLDSGG
jgi:hypothetical protein